MRPEAVTGVGTTCPRFVRDNCLQLQVLMPTQLSLQVTQKLCRRVEKVCDRAENARQIIPDGNQ